MPSSIADAIFTEETFTPSSGYSAGALHSSAVFRQFYNRESDRRAAQQADRLLKMMSATAARSTSAAWPASNPAAPAQVPVVSAAAGPVSQSEPAVKPVPTVKPVPVAKPGTIKKAAPAAKASTTGVGTTGQAKEMPLRPKPQVPSAQNDGTASAPSVPTQAGPSQPSVSRKADWADMVESSDEMEDPAEDLVKPFGHLKIFGAQAAGAHPEYVPSKMFDDEDGEDLDAAADALDFLFRGKQSSAYKGKAVAEPTVAKAPVGKALSTARPVAETTKTPAAVGQSLAAGLGASRHVSAGLSASRYSDVVQKNVPKPAMQLPMHKIAAQQAKAEAERQAKRQAQVKEMATRSEEKRQEKHAEKMVAIARSYKQPQYKMSVKDRIAAWNVFLPHWSLEAAPLELGLPGLDYCYRYIFGETGSGVDDFHQRMAWSRTVIWFETTARGPFTKLVVGLRDEPKPNKPHQPRVDANDAQRLMRMWFSLVEWSRQPRTKGTGPFWRQIRSVYNQYEGEDLPVRFQRISNAHKSAQEKDTARREAAAAVQARDQAPPRETEIRQLIITSSSVDEMRKAAQRPLVEDDMKVITAFQQEIRASTALRAVYGWVLEITAKDLGF